MLKYDKEKDYEVIMYERSGYVVRIILNKPDSLNTGVKDFDKALTKVEEADEFMSSSSRGPVAPCPFIALNEVGFCYSW